MWKTLAILSALLLIVFLVSAQDKQTPPKSNASTPYHTVPLEAARARKIRSNRRPSRWLAARSNTATIARCATGKEGDGKGEVGADLKLKMHDETDPVTSKVHTDGELFYIIKKGKDLMPPEGDGVKDETIWDIVHYVRSFAKKAEADKPADEKAPN
jgi:Cytochrome C oxidase, cbb3-type, subunit III